MLPFHSLLAEQVGSLLALSVAICLGREEAFAKETPC